ncbi:hypothetical protein B0T14DRAFT_559265 [Immersiella caudata]|uniref:Uncharacterized protein n=1 Tax=Immersiella caudata TaxID=314043 RepID=A0AA39XE23_9PEZI|nr:hypothetical protein B0T14DRAFT_559265 [Immersiella caudata]
MNPLGHTTTLYGAENPGPVPTEPTSRHSLRATFRRVFQFGSLSTASRSSKPSANALSTKRSSLLSVFQLFNREPVYDGAGLTENDTTYKKRRNVLRKKQRSESGRIQHMFDLLSNDDREISVVDPGNFARVPGQDRSPVIHHDEVILNPRVRSHQAISRGTSTATGSERNTSASTNITADTTITSATSAPLQTSITCAEPSFPVGRAKGISPNRSSSPTPCQHAPFLTAPSFSEGFEQRLNNIPELPESPIRRGPTNSLSEYNAIVDSMFHYFMLDNNEDSHEDKEAPIFRDHFFEPYCNHEESNKKTVDHVLATHRSDSSLLGSIYEKYLASREDLQLDYASSVYSQN